MEIQTNVEHITPDFANYALARNQKNRTVNISTVKRYAGAIQRNEWMLNGEPIIFDVDGKLINGQHRLRAVLLANRPIMSLVVRGVSNEVFKTLDAGKRRSSSDVLGLFGYKNVRGLNSAARAIIFIQEGVKVKQTATSSAIVEVVQSHPTLPSWIELFRNSKAEKFMPSAFMGALCLASEKHGEARILDFFNKVSDGLNLTAEDPALILRDRFIAQGKHSRIRENAALGYCLKAINAYLTASPIKRLIMRDDEKLPTLV